MSTEPQLDASAVTWQTWARILGLGIVCSVAGAWWEQQSQLIRGSIHVAEAVPPLSGIASLLFLLALGPVLGATGVYLKLKRQEILMSYAFVCVSVTIGFIGLYRQVLAKLTSPLYIRDFRSTADAIVPFLPDWLVAKDPEAIRTFWESLQGKPLPWGEWMLPLFSLGAIFILFYFTTSLLIGYFFRRWSQDERLTFPVAELAIELVGQRHASGAGELFRNPAFRWGVGLAVFFNLFYIIPSLASDWKLPPYQVNFSFMWPNALWKSGGYGPIYRFNPVVIGLGFLVPTRVLLTIWVTMFLLKAEAIVIHLFGVPSGWGGPLFHIYEQEGIGGYLGFFIVMLWATRKYGADAFRQFSSNTKVKKNAPGRFTLIGIALGIAGLMAVLTGAGMVFWFAAFFLGMLLVRVVLMARIRAQAGIANIYLHTIGMTSFIWMLGGKPFAVAGHSTIAALCFMSILVAFTFVTPHQLDGFRLAEVTGFGYRRWIWLSLIAVACGYLLATLFQFPTIYEHGFANLRQKPSIWPADHVINVAREGKSANPVRHLLMGLGLVTTTGFAILQQRFYWFPLSPIGFVVSCAIGRYIALPMMSVWAVKATVLHLGGGSAYRSLRRLGIGLAFGHLAVASLWGILGLFDVEATRRYFIGFW